ncbi:MAG: condensation domain-containing protein, partial [Bradymonadaceae bacterium]
LREAFEALVARHEILRTVYPARNGEPVQRIQPDSTLDWTYRYVDDERIDEWIDEAVATPFELAEETPLRVRLWEGADGPSLLLVVFHHIAIDEWTMGVMLEELGELYAANREGRAPQLEEPSLQYADYAIWQTQRLDGEAYEEGLDFWRRHLETARGGIEWPVDRTAAAEKSPAERVRFEWGETVSEAVRQCAETQATSRFLVLYAAFVGYLGRLTGHWDVTVGVPVTQRERPELQGVLGFFLNTLPMRTRTGPEHSFEQWLREVVAQWREVIPHQWIPLDAIVDAVGAERTGRRLPLFDAMFTFLPDQPTPSSFGDLDVEHIERVNAPEAKCGISVIA